MIRQPTNSLSPWERDGVRVRSTEDRIEENVAMLLEDTQ